jgi:hypothetical protein
VDVPLSSYGVDSLAAGRLSCVRFRPIQVKSHALLDSLFNLSCKCLKYN